MSTRRAAASWSQRHRARIDEAFAAFDPRADQQYGDDHWSDAELVGWIATVEHLKSHGLYGSCWQVPASVRQAWYRRRCPCGRGAE